MVGVMFRGGADMAVRRVDCCDCILRDRCHWLGGGVLRWRLRFGVGFSDGVVGLENPPRRGSGGVIEVGLVGG